MVQKYLFIDSNLKCFMNIAVKRVVSLHERTKLQYLTSRNTDPNTGSDCQVCYFQYYKFKIAINSRFGLEDLLRLANIVNECTHGHKLDIEKIICSSMTLTTLKEALKSAAPEFYRDPYNVVDLPSCRYTENIFAFMDDNRPHIVPYLPLERIIERNSNIFSGVSSNHLVSLIMEVGKHKLLEFCERCQLGLYQLTLSDAKYRENVETTNTTHLIAEALRQNYNLTENLMFLSLNLAEEEGKR